MLSGDEDAILEPGELALLYVYLPDGALQANDRLTLELLSPTGGTLILSRRLPPVLQPVMPLP